MLSPEISGNEEFRQQVLDDQELLDTPADPYLDTLVRVVRELFEVETVLVSLIDHERQWFKARLGLDVAETPRSVSFCGHAILASEHFIVEDASADPRFADNPLVTGHPFLRFYAGQPLFAENGQALGTLCLIHSQAKQLNERQLRLLRDMATLVEGYLKLRSVSQQTAQLRVALSREQRKAMLDPLTQLWNRAGLEHFLQRELRLAQERGLQLGLLFCDLDHFKSVNDTHGHGAGDQALWESARCIAAAVRPQDVVSRSGGEEFVVLTQVHDQQELLQIAERVRSQLDKTPIITGGVQLSLTLSIGGALARPGETPDAALARADRALYQAKANGRNRVELASD
ncbi:sensor domain-containing diguanylate cyclase [Pseudomonas sp. SA3-5]|uniref:Sensor domain-containing diguanylate cyclase n=1 Tax=Pseudomonas aestuarii TaxID=3018340 RepID=A0ABT4X9Q7_9PSED|nr:sensor domain-containing diguanylate cyclase [Pseudomonas aestuarii]MDA7085026.1 sensor domain-containing diguanylate cyclase [Pseudomonas aestuarii]